MQQVIEDVSFTCGAPLQDSELPGRLNEVLSCGDPIEKLYYNSDPYVSIVLTMLTQCQRTSILSLLHCLQLEYLCKVLFTKSIMT